MYDINVLVNGKRCKQYTHDSRTFIQANHGSEYSLEFKNNTSNRVLVVGSVDGLSVMDGKTATPEGSGYVVEPHSKLEIKGYRYSDNEVGAFKFVNKSNSYASSKGSKAVKNVGVIGFRIFGEESPKELIKIIKETTIKEYPVPYNPWPIWPKTHPWYYDPYLYSTGVGPGNNSWITYSNCNSSMIGETLGALTDSGPSDSEIKFQNMSPLRSANFFSQDKPTKGFDTGTGWGVKKESKVVSVQFTRGDLLFTKEIYYASRESLIEMGVPISNEQKVAFPQSFPGKYAEPPKNWRG